MDQNTAGWADQDPDGRFIRRWVPELADVPNEHIARPEEMPPLTQHMAGCLIGETYPTIEPSSPGGIISHLTLVYLDYDLTRSVVMARLFPSATW